MKGATLPFKAVRTTRAPIPVTIYLVAIVAAAMLIRAPGLGDPAYKIDEQFYLLVGDRMLHGALPYVDIWDRKPIGLFLIYAGARLLGGEGFVQYQLLATACAAGTALCIFALSARYAGRAGATVAAILYLLWIEIAEGGGGQSPIFYNLPMAGAAALLMWRGERRAVRFAAMALVGLALQIKYTAVVEGFLFGLVATGAAWRSDRRAALAEVPLLALTALAPTLAAFGTYVALGHLHEFWFANFTSIFLRAETPPEDLSHRTLQGVLRILPLGASAAVAAWHVLHSDADRDARRWLMFMAAWCGAAMIGFFAVGTLYSHYLLPAFVPFTVAAAPIFRRWPTGYVFAAILAWLPTSDPTWLDMGATSRSSRQIADLSALVPANVRTGCMQMFDGPPILYYVTGACTVSRYIFPDHLSAAIERKAIGIDPEIETRRVLARQPLVITIGDSDVRPPNTATFRLMREGLARDYRLAGRTWIDVRTVSVYIRRQRDDQ